MYPQAVCGRPLSLRGQWSNQISLSSANRKLERVISCLRLLPLGIEEKPSRHVDTFTLSLKPCLVGQIVLLKVNVQQNLVSIPSSHVSMLALHLQRSRGGLAFGAKCGGWYIWTSPGHHTLWTSVAFGLSKGSTFHRMESHNKQSLLELVVTFVSSSPLFWQPDKSLPQVEVRCHAETWSWKCVLRWFDGSESVVRALKRASLCMQEPICVQWEGSWWALTNVGTLFCFGGAWRGLKQALVESTSPVASCKILSGH